MGRIGWFQSTVKTCAFAAVMPRILPVEESAESIVVVSESVSSLCLLGFGEECGKLVRSKARTEEEEATGGDL
jgi:hypothetical protein